MLPMRALYRRFMSEDNHIVTPSEHHSGRQLPSIKLPTPADVIGGIESVLGAIFGIPQPAATPPPTSTVTEQAPPTTTTTTTTQEASTTNAPQTTTTTITSDFPTATPTEAEKSTSTTDSETADATTESTSTTVTTSSSSSSSSSSPTETSTSITSSSTPSSALVVIPSSSSPVSESTFSSTTEGVPAQTGLSTSDKSVKKNTPMIAGGVVGILALVSISLFLFLCLRRRYLKRKSEAALEDASSFIMPPPRHFEPQRYLPAKFRNERERIASSSYPSATDFGHPVTDSEEPESFEVDHDDGTHTHSDGQRQRDEHRRQISRGQPATTSGGKSLYIVIPPRELREPPPHYTP